MHSLSDKRSVKMSRSNHSCEEKRERRPSVPCPLFTHSARSSHYLGDKDLGEPWWRLKPARDSGVEEDMRRERLDPSFLTRTALVEDFARSMAILSILCESIAAGFARPI